MRRFQGFFVLLLALTSFSGTATATTGENAIATSCVNGASAIDFDTLAQCSSTSSTAGTMQRAPIIVGPVTTPPYTATTCDSSKAGMLQYTASSFQVCNGSSWNTLQGSTGGSGDFKTILLMHMDGSNASTTFTDEATNSITAYGSAMISTTQSKFGGSSGYFNGSTDYVRVNDSAAFNFGTSDFTIDTWIYPLTPSGSNGTIFYTGGENSVAGIFLAINSSGYITFQSLIGNTITGSTSLLNAWHHIALVHYSGTVYLYVDGALVGSLALSSIGQTYAPYIGTSYVSSTLQHYFKGYIDEFRISKGIARWTSSFTPATAAYSACSSQSTNCSLTGTAHAYAYTGSTQTLTVPSGVYSITAKVWGAGGGSAGTGSTGGAGGYSYGTLKVTPGTALSIVVGGAGQPSCGTTSAFGGGGHCAGYDGAGGGGRSAVQISSADVLTAGGGGGGGHYYGSYTTYVPGGPGGGSSGTAGGDGSSYNGQGGTQSAGGAVGSYTGYTAGTAGSQYSGGTASNSGGSAAGDHGAGGGGGGYYGGGGGGVGYGWTGGGGGSGYYSTNIVGCSPSLLSGSSTTPPNNADSDYVSGIGAGGTAGSAGGNGRIVLYY